MLKFDLVKFVIGVKGVEIRHAFFGPCHGQLLQISIPEDFHGILH